MQSSLQDWHKQLPSGGYQLGHEDDSNVRLLVKQLYCVTTDMIACNLGLPAGLLQPCKAIVLGGHTLWVSTTLTFTAGFASAYSTLVSRYNDSANVFRQSCHITAPSGSRMLPNSMCRAHSGPMELSPHCRCFRNARKQVPDPSTHGSRLNDTGSKLGANRIMQEHDSQYSGQPDDCKMLEACVLSAQLGSPA